MRKPKLFVINNLIASNDALCNLQRNQALDHVRRAKSASRCSRRALDLAISMMSRSRFSTSAIVGRAHGLCSQHSWINWTTCEEASTSVDLRNLLMHHVAIETSRTK